MTLLPSVCVIGAGSSGIAAVKALRTPASRRLLPLFVHPATVAAGTPALRKGR